MALLMPRPTRRSESTFHIFRARVPADVLDAARGRTIAFPFPAEAGESAHIAFATAGSEVKFSLRTRDPSVAKARHGIALAHLEQQWSALRSGPQPLSQRQVVALSGCLIPDFNGAVFSLSCKDALQARFTTGAPRRRRRSVERYSIVKRA